MPASVESTILVEVYGEGAQPGARTAPQFKAKPADSGQLQDIGDLLDTPARDLSGSALGHYQVVEHIGRGGMSQVYRAIQQSLGREVALKVLSRSLLRQPGFLQRFDNEAKTIARLDHPNILPVFDYDTQDGVIFLAMPLVRGGTLKDRLDEQGIIDLFQSWRYISEIGDALHHAHEAGVVHRDLKPTNILMHTDGRAMLTDFGLARSIDAEQLTMAGEIIGTPAYMAPEQILQKPVDRRADIYALGIVLFQMLTGTLPYSADSTAGFMVAALQEPIPSARARNSMLPPEVNLVLTRALAKHPADRQQTVQELLQELRVALGSLIRSEKTLPWSLGEQPPVMPSVQAFGGFVAGVAEAPPLANPPPAAAYQQEAAGSALSTLERMGIPKLHSSQRYIANAYFAAAIEAAREVAGSRWPHLVQIAGITEYRDQLPPAGRERAALGETLSRVHEGFEQVFGHDAPSRVRLWGRLTAEKAGIVSGRGPLQLLPGQHRKVSSLLKGFAHAMDQVRGEHLHAWKQIDQSQFWLVHYSNLYALGRRKQEKACHLWTATLEALLRRAGLANDWLVEEMECGCVTGTFDCVFVIHRDT